ncbi:hypothetical protein [Hymenobacter arizonensis]|uniref:Dolichyl-phosphate-mannose-protein mannosyltransferase n=1 Tax=Hymenobacter arizonensis TaxID=1227077 RepID=A0A1I5U6A5_HYMAR|nr:hypothetical protein [Hymenobacter arizonensis]SFP90845.1 hypothetical protein SAMN04515668_0784 [Hymenobacter arizonensis]
MSFATALDASTNQFSRRQEAVLIAAVAAAYVAYLFTSEYIKLYYDAEDYWQLGHRFYHLGRFELLAYDDSLRGYSYPLVNFLCLAVRKALQVEAITVVKCFNVGLAAFFFGFLAPRLWQVTTHTVPLTLARRCLFAALGFIFWRGYFNFSLSDFPALIALVASLWQVQQRGLRAAFLAGVALALAVNIRSIYLASVPTVLLLVFLSPRQLWWPRLLVLSLGAGLILAPQWLINRRHFNANTPLVLAVSPTLNIQNLYLEKLKWGLLNIKCETAIGWQLPSGQMTFLDAKGADLMLAENLNDFTSTWHYLQVTLRHPRVIASSYVRHIFAGLDITHPTPYIKRWEPSQWLQGLNYTLWFWVVLAAFRFRPTMRQGLVLGSLLLPCLAVLPMSMEIRYLLPLHLLLLSVVAFDSWPVWAVATIRRAAITAVASVLFVWCCFSLSANVTKSVEPRYHAHLLK